MMNIEASVFSRIMRGVRPMPEGMEARIYAALDRLEAAERAADEARRRVLDGDEFDIVKGLSHARAPSHLVTPQGATQT